MREIYQASDPAARGDAWQSVIVPALLPVWWATFLIGNFASRVESRMAFSDDLATVRASTWVGPAASLIVIIAAIAAITLVRCIHARQQDKAASMRW